jgi:hypothetical protein
VDFQPNENVSLVRVRPDGSLEALTIELSEDVPRRNDVGRYYRIQTFVNLNNSDFLLLRFDTDQILVGGGPETLTDFITGAPFNYENYNTGQARIFAFHVVDRGQSISEEQIRQLILELMPPQQPVIPFVTVTPITLRESFLQGYELWFHLDGIAEQNEGRLDELHQENMALYVERAPGVVDDIPYELAQIRPNVWMVFPQTGDDGLPPLVRFVFSLERPMNLIAFNPDSGGLEDFATLADYINKTGQQLEGHRVISERFGEALVVYAREQSAAGRLEE